tara:strand:+ start:2422 stop:2607 length:186 start_codon:yes stop_codon:yes gene_type:complete
VIRHHTLWADPRLAEAYDLVADVVRDHSIAEDKLPEVAAVLIEIDNADQMLAGILHERRAK